MTTSIFQTIFTLCAKTVELYSTLCLIRIFMTWIPPLNNSRIGYFLSSICDPYMNLFRSIPLRISGLDFTPMISLGLLYLISSVLQGIANTGKLYLGGILIELVILLYQILSSIISIFLIALIIRGLVMAFTKDRNNYNSIWYQFDYAVSPFLFKIASPFSRKQAPSLKKALIITIIFLVLSAVLLRIATVLLVHALKLIPF